MINEIKFRDEHPILRGLHLNFSKEDGTPYKTIIVAGENGCGKTTIFENLEVLMLGEIGAQDCFKFFDAIGYTAIHAGKIVNTTLKCNFHDNTRAVLQFADFPSPIHILGISRMLEETRPAIYAKQMIEISVFTLLFMPCKNWISHGGTYIHPDITVRSWKTSGVL